MMELKYAIFSILSICIFSTGYANEIYKWRDAAGVIHYSNRPAPGAKAIGQEYRFDEEAHKKRIEHETLQRQFMDLEDKLEDLEREFKAKSHSSAIMKAPTRETVVFNSSPAPACYSGNYYRRRPVIIKPRQVPAGLQWRRYWDNRKPYYERRMNSGKR